MLAVILTQRNCQAICNTFCEFGSRLFAVQSGRSLRAHNFGRGTRRERQHTRQLQGFYPRFHVAPRSNSIGTHITQKASFGNGAA